MMTKKSIMIDDEESGVVKLGDSKGIGDASLYGLYRFVNNEQTGLQVSVLGGVKMPTGDTKEKTKEGDRFEAEHQPGSGSWDPLFGIGVSMPWNSGTVLLWVPACFTSFRQKVHRIRSLVTGSSTVSHWPTVWVVLVRITTMTMVRMANGI
jgi:hypothetical protein